MSRRIGLECCGLGVILAAALCATMNSSARACDTPVYRYAMYRWLPAPYELYYFYSGELDAAAQQMKAAVDTAGENAEAPANVVFLPVDLVKDKDLSGVPPDIKEAWQKQEQAEVPAYLVSSPVGVHLFLGSLTLAELESLIDSPLRQQAGKLLEEGKAGVYILLLGEDVAANAAAEKEIQGVVTDVAAGKISLYTIPLMAGEGEEGQNGAKLEIGYLKVARDDAGEKWLVDSLLGLEPDLRASKEPIVVMLYGRGRALFSCLGKGIHRDNLIQDVEFITGACSCTVKEQNPGVDLLMRYNWDGAAEALAQLHGTEEGSPYDFGGNALFPELVIPPDSGMAGSEAPPDGQSDQSGQAVAQVDLTADSDRTAETAAGQSAAQERIAPDSVPPSSTAGREKSPEQETQKVAMTPPVDRQPSAAPAASSDGEPTSTFRGMLWVGAGLIGALVVLFGATFVVLRPK